MTKPGLGSFAHHPDQKLNQNIQTSWTNSYDKATTFVDEEGARELKVNRDLVVNSLCGWESLAGKLKIQK